MSAPLPAKGRPGRVVLDGRYTRLEPLGPQHTPDLWHAMVPERFTYLFNEAPADQAELEKRIAIAAAETDPLWFAVIDRSSGKAQGQQSLMRITPEHGVVEIGGIYWGPHMARTRVSTEALFLHARYVFEDLGYRRFEWKCNALNAPSRAAALRFGFEYEGIFRQHMIVKGQNRDTAWFAMLDTDWARIKAAYERWLDPANFDMDGAQKTRLETR